MKLASTPIDMDGDGTGEVVMVAYPIEYDQKVWHYIYLGDASCYRYAGSMYAKPTLACAGTAHGGLCDLIVDLIDTKQTWSFDGREYRAP